jgi:hypothetical protein
MQRANLPHRTVPPCHRATLHQHRPYWDAAEEKCFIADDCPNSNMCEPFIAENYENTGGEKSMTCVPLLSLLNALEGAFLVAICLVF